MVVGVDRVEAEHRWPGLDMGVVDRVVGPVLTGLVASAGVANVIRTVEGPVVGSGSDRTFVVVERVSGKRHPSDRHGHARHHRLPHLINDS